MVIGMIRKHELGHGDLAQGAPADGPAVVAVVRDEKRAVVGDAWFAFRSLNSS